MNRKLLQTIFLPLILLLCTLGVSAQTKVVTGRVTDTKGTGIAGVTVSAKGSNAATATSENGDYSLTVPSNTTTLVFSSVGYGAQEYSISGNTVNVSLSQVTGNLNEVVVVGYGTQRRRDITGSVATVTTKDFNQGVNPSPERLIMGKVAGVQVTPGGGAPGSGSAIRIRGGASLNASNDPLIVIDGVPVSNNGVAGSANVLSTINPNDIESMNILKDASATAIYGSRASNGVILITTKRGSRGDKLRVNFSALGTLSERSGEVDVLTADEVRTYVNANGTAAQKAMLGTASTDWQDVIFRKAYGQEYNLSLSGGFKPLPYRFNFGFLDQDGILKTSSLRRYSAALGLFPSFLDRHLNVTMNAKVSRSQSRFANEGAIGNAINFDPTQQVYQKNGPAGYFEWLDATTGLPNTLSNRNPLALLELNDNRSEVDRFLGNIQLDYKLHWFPDLRLNLNLGYDVQQGDGRVRIPANAATQLTASGTPTNPGIRRFGTGDIYDQLNKNKLAEFFINYNKDVKAIRSVVDFTAGYSYQDFTFQNNNYVPLTYAGLPAPTTTQPLFPENFNQQTLLSYYGRLNLTFAEMFTINGTLRRDASSVFRKDLRWGTFPAVGASWTLKSLPFLKDVAFLSELKLRAGYGITGQQDIVGSVGYYPYIPGYFRGDSSSMYQFGTGYVSTFAPSPYNSNLKWEETETINAGLDFGLFNGRLNGSVDVFRKTSRDLLANVSWALGTNFTNEFIRNIGSFEGKGLEIGLNANPVRNKDWNITVGFNATFLDREIKKLNDVTPKDFLGFRVGGIGGGTGNRIQVHTVGYAPSSFFVYQQVYDANGKPIEGLYVDQNKDGIINERDLYRYKQPAPTAQYGFNSSLGYKRVTLGFSMRANTDNYVYNNINSGQVATSILSPLNYLGNASRDFLNTGFKNNQYFSDYYITNASFLKMDYISLGYNLGKLGHSKAGLRLTATVQNAFVVTKYKGLDPEHFGGIDNQLYPRPRIYSLGVNLDY